MNQSSLLAALAALALVSSAACVLPSYEGSSGEGGAGGSAAPGGLTTTSSAPTSNGSTSTSTDASSGIGVSSGAEATSSASVASSSGSDIASSSASVVASSSASGASCLPALDPCANVEPYDFADEPGLQERFDVDQPEAKAMGGRLRLDPEGPEGTEAVLKAKEDVEIESDCAIWVTLHTTNADGSSGLGLGDGSLAGAHLRVQREGEQLVSHAPSAGPTSVPFDQEEMRHVRIRVSDGEAYLDYAAEKSCWTQLSGPHDRNGDKPTMFHAGPGNAQLDDYCID
jgi:hypothetical protein